MSRDNFCGNCRHYERAKLDWGWCNAPIPAHVEAQHINDGVYFRGGKRDFGRLCKTYEARNPKEVGQ